MVLDTKDVRWINRALAQSLACPHDVAGLDQRPRSRPDHVELRFRLVAAGLRRERCREDLAAAADPEG